jgi:uncharacterized membrane protein YfcA
MTWWEALLLVVGGLAAGVINTMAGGGSALTVPLLVLAGVPGNQANGSNRVGILAASAAAVVSFRRSGTSLAGSGKVLLPTVIGSVVGSYTISGLADDTFETVFGLLMIPIVVLTVMKPKPKLDVEPWPAWVTFAVFLAIGLYGGAFQAGVGLVLLAALTRAGYDLVTANNVKVFVNLIVTVFALPVFILRGDVVWGPALTLAAGFMTGGWFGAKLAVKGGEQLVRWFMIAAAIFLAGNLLGLW